jgi:hypothetical protein
MARSGRPGRARTGRARHRNGGTGRAGRRRSAGGLAAGAGAARRERATGRAEATAWGRGRPRGQQRGCLRRRRRTCRAAGTAEGGLMVRIAGCGAWRLLWTRTMLKPAGAPPRLVVTVASRSEMVESLARQIPRTLLQRRSGWTTGGGGRGGGDGPGPDGVRCGPARTVTACDGVGLAVRRQAARASLGKARGVCKVAPSLATPPRPPTCRPAAPGGGRAAVGFRWGLELPRPAASRRRRRRRRRGGGVGGVQVQCKWVPCGGGGRDGPGGRRALRG